KAGLFLNGGIREAMYQLDFRDITVPAQQGNTATFCTKIDCDQGSRVACWRAISALPIRFCLALMQRMTHRRKASVSPPSTGIRCPVVQRDLGPARNRIASAQSLGSMARWVNVRLA